MRAGSAQLTVGTDHRFDLDLRGNYYRQTSLFLMCGHWKGLRGTCSYVERKFGKDHAFLDGPHDILYIQRFIWKDAVIAALFCFNDAVEAQAYDPLRQRLAVASHSGQIKMCEVENHGSSCLLPSMITRLRFC